MKTALDEYKATKQLDEWLTAVQLDLRLTGAYVDHDEHDGHNEQHSSNQHQNYHKNFLKRRQRRWHGMRLIQLHGALTTTDYHTSTDATNIVYRTTFILRQHVSVLVGLLSQLETTLTH